jgi:hypothetical protein
MTSIAYSSIMLVPAAQARLDGTLRDSNAVDTKALGVLAIDLGSIALLVAVHNSINSLWWVPGNALVVAGGLLGAAIWPRKFYFGPDLRRFYVLMAESTPLDASRQMLVALLWPSRKTKSPGKFCVCDWV